jgi:hypothetical protein
MNKMGRRTLLTGAVTTALLAGGLAVSSPAMAATGSDVVIQGNVPNCVRVWVTRGTFTQTGNAENGCGYRINMKIIWAFGADGPCASVPDAWTLQSKVTIEPRRFDGAGTC